MFRSKTCPTWVLARVNVIPCALCKEPTRPFCATLEPTRPKPPCRCPRNTQEQSDARLQNQGNARHQAQGDARPQEQGDARLQNQGDARPQEQGDARPQEQGDAQLITCRVTK